MGKEARCIVLVNDTAAEAKAHLDSAFLTLSGGHRLIVPLASVTDVTVAGETLRLSATGTAVEMQLGAQVAHRWAEAIAHPKSRLAKLGIQGAERVYVGGDFDADFIAELNAGLATPPAAGVAGNFDVMFLSVAGPAGLLQIAGCRAQLAPHGVLWVVHVKGATSAVPEKLVRAAILEAGMYESKVVAFSPARTAMGAAIARKDR